MMTAAMHRQMNSLEMLLRYGAQPDTRDMCGNTALHECARTFALQSMQKLLSYGANPNVANDKGKRAYNLYFINYCQREIS